MVHRNSTPPAYHFTLQSFDRQWEGLFVLTDHMDVDHMYAWLSLAADGGEPDCNEPTDRATKSLCSYPHHSLLPVVRECESE